MGNILFAIITGVI